MKTVFEADKDFICDIQSPCFQSLSSDELEVVRASKTQVQFRKGDNLTKQGTFASYVLFMVKGLAKQYIEGDVHKSFNLSLISPGEFVGLSSVFEKTTFSYSVMAISDCQAFLVEKEAVAKLMKTNGEFGFKISKRYCSQNAKLFEAMNSLLYRQMNGRLATALLYINSFKPGYPEIFQLLSRKDIAEFAGISTESAVKILKALEKESIVRLNEKDVELLEHNKLERIALNG